MIDRNGLGPAGNAHVHDQRASELANERTNGRLVDDDEYTPAGITKGRMMEGTHVDADWSIEDG